MSYDLVLAGRLAAKVTLGASCLAFGESFISTPLAEELRARLQGDADVPPLRFAGDALQRLDDVVQQFAPTAGRMPALAPSSHQSQVVLIRAPGQVVAVVHLQGWDLGVLNLRSPLDARGRRYVVIQDGSPSVSVRYFEDDLARALSACQNSSSGAYRRVRLSSGKTSA